MSGADEIEMKAEVFWRFRHLGRVQGLPQPLHIAVEPANVALSRSRRRQRGGRRFYDHPHLKELQRNVSLQGLVEGIRSQQKIGTHGQDERACAGPNLENIQR